MGGGVGFLIFSAEYKEAAYMEQTLSVLEDGWYTA